jgi:hypothetical protein
MSQQKKFEDLQIISRIAPEKPEPTPFELWEEALIEGKGKVLLGLVHDFYGPMKDFYAYVRPTNQQMLHKYLDSPAVKVFGYKQEELIVEFWNKTKLGCRVMVLPMKMVEEHKLEPLEFENTIQLHTYFMKLARKAVPLSIDQWYYRKGELK